MWRVNEAEDDDSNGIFDWDVVERERPEIRVWRDVTGVRSQRKVQEIDYNRRCIMDKIDASFRIDRRNSHVSR